MHCAKCDVCCRFLDEETPLAPVGLKLKHYRDRFICEKFDPTLNKCVDYENRPLDCRMYPFVIMWDEEYKNVVLGIDHKCPHAKEETEKLKNEKTKKLIKDIDPKYIIRFQDDVEILETLDIKVETQNFASLPIGDKALFEKYACLPENPLSTYSFTANYVWTGLLDYYWMVIDDNLCLFCKSGAAIFMPIPPLGKNVSGAAVRKCFEVMNKINKNKNFSRIEDIREKDAPYYKGLGYKIREKGQEYIYNRIDVADLAGERYKDKRALYNYFTKNYKYEYRQYSPGDEKACLALYGRWASGRIKSRKGTVPNANMGTVPVGNCPHDVEYYKALLEDSYAAHKKAMDRFRDLGLEGRVVIKKGTVLGENCPQLAAYTFGYPLNDDTFIVLFEVADLSVKGLPQFIFRQFVREMGSYKYINVMDDSGLENLKKAKMSYHPVKVERTFCAYE